MSLPPADLSLDTLAHLAELAGSAGPAPAQPARVTASGSGNVFSAQPVTENLAEKSAPYPGGSPLVTGVPVLPAEIERNAEWEERAAILEYEGGWPRTTAEMITNKLMSLERTDSTTENMRNFDRELIALERRMSASKSSGRAGNPATRTPRGG